MPRKKKTFEPRECANPNCKQTFTPRRKWQEYCKPSCGTAVRQQRFIQRKVREALGEQDV